MTIPSVIADNIAPKYHEEVAAAGYPDVCEALRRLNLMLDKRERKIKRLEKKVERLNQ